MKRRRVSGIMLAVAILCAVCLTPGSTDASDYESELPSKDFWFQATPSVVWAGDPASVTTLQVHIVERDDIERVWMTGLGSEELYGRRELFDDGTHGDKRSGDFVFTLSGVSLDFQLPNEDGYGLWWGYVRAETKDGVMLGDEYGSLVGLVDPAYRDVFPVQDLGNGLFATHYAFFIEDMNHEVIDSYPVSNVYCGTSNFAAYQKLYSVFPDVFDFASLMPGMQIFRPSDLHENVPYNNGVSNQVAHIGRTILDNTAHFGSSGRLKSVTYSSFGSIAIMDHELAHTWGMAIGKDLGLIKEADMNAELGHWNKMTDIGGQMSAVYLGDGLASHFAYNGDGTWRLIPNTANQPYAPLELYLMGLIPSSEIPDIHILHAPDLTDPARITAQSYETVTAQQIVESAGGERVPSAGESQKEFNLAFIVTQDLPYNDAAYAYFSLLSKELMSREPPKEGSYLAPFYWATGGRATLNTYLGDYGVLSLPEEEATPEPAPTEIPAAETTTQVVAVSPADGPAAQQTQIAPAAAPAEPEQNPANRNGLLLFGGGALIALIIIVALLIRAAKKRRTN